MVLEWQGVYEKTEIVGRWLDMSSIGDKRLSVTLVCKDTSGHYHSLNGSLIKFEL
jgi:hypothetical protein